MRRLIAALNTFTSICALQGLSKQPQRELRFVGERVLWIQPYSLEELLELKATYPNAKLVVGNTEVGESHMHYEYYSLNQSACLCWLILNKDSVWNPIPSECSLWHECSLGALHLTYCHHHTIVTRILLIQTYEYSFHILLFAYNFVGTYGYSDAAKLLFFIYI